MDDFNISCTKLLNDFPLYQYVQLMEDGKKALNILLLGSGSRMDTLLQHVLTCGQMLDTVLDVTVVNANAASTADSFMRKVPAAAQFIRVLREYKQLTEPSARLCTLRFESALLSPENLPDILLAREECTYVLISTGNSERNRQLAYACSGYTANRRTLVAYVQDKPGKDKDSALSTIQIHSFGPKRDPSYFSETERIAFNLHYIYEKGQDCRKPMRQIEESFRDPYNYISNIEAAIHIRTKLACCGIDDSDMGRAAEVLNSALRDDPLLLERLSAMEHNRWLMSKVLKGYIPMPTADLIYSAPGVGTHDSKAKWHCCLVPCDLNGNSRIEDGDWDTPIESCREDLDSLDRVTLLIHDTCKKISEGNRPRVEQMLQTVSGALSLEGGYSIETLACEKQLEAAVGQLWAGKRSAVSLIHKSIDALVGRVRSEGLAQSFILQNTLDMLEQVLAPCIEYVSHKDYKEQDRILVAQIPYALTRDPNLFLVKTLSAELPKNLYSTRQLNPQRVAFCAIARDEAEVTSLPSRADQIRNFILTHCEETTPEFHLFAPKLISPSLLSACRDSGFLIHEIEDISLNTLNESISAALADLGISAIDISGGDPLVNHAFCTYAEHCEIGVFYVQGGTLSNLFGAEQFEYAMPQKSLTVQELFDMAGAVPEDNETSHLSDLTEKYRSLWEISRKTINWDSFCKDVSSAYRSGMRHPFIFYPSLTFHPDAPGQITGALDATAALIPALRKLEKAGCIKDLSATREPGELRTVRYTLRENIADPAKLEDFIKRAIGSYRLNTTFSVGRYNGYPTLGCSDLFVRAFTVLEDKREDYELLLHDLEEQNIIINHRVDMAGQHSFSFVTREALTCMQKSGNVLERLVYYAAIFDGHFDDVELGWKFMHSMNSDSAENEVDLICTKGLRSLFVSAKMVSAQQLTFGNNLNYILYEISLIAQRFGINATPVLVAPALKQLNDSRQDGQQELSNVAKLALKRGVYLLGEECIQRNLIGQTLDRIISGDKDWWHYTE